MPPTEVVTPVRPDRSDHPDQDGAPSRAAAPAPRPASPPAFQFAALLGPRVPWTRTTLLALLALALLWSARVHSTWGAWGDLTVDCGREMYVPAVLAQGKTLYKDVYYNYAPAAPYLNSFLFRLFGVNLSVLYGAGSLAALASAVFLFLAGMELSSWIAGWTAAAVVLMQAFQPSLFSFPLPYTFAAVYGCAAACFFLWCLVRVAATGRRAWLIAAASAAAAALLCKLEFGLACYGALLLLLLARAVRARSRSEIARDAAAAVPGIAAVTATIAWMISLGGAVFLTQQNLASTWPWSYFMRTYSKAWLAFAGLTVTPAALLQALWQTLVFAAAVWIFYQMLCRARSDAAGPFVMAAMFVAALAYLAGVLSWQAEAAFRWIFFPQAMVAYVAIAAFALWWRVLRKPAAVPDVAPPSGHDAALENAPESARLPALALACTFSALLAARIFLGMVPAGYPIYYDGPAVLCFLLLIRAIVPRAGRSPRFIARAEALVCGACLIAAIAVSLRVDAFAADDVPLVTPRGTILVSRHMASNYQAALAFIRDKAAQGDAVLSVPEDVSLYFLSATEAPARVSFFSPGIVAPGAMEDEAIRELEAGRVRYILWSNRTFPEYGAPVFGKDFNVALGRYLTSHYHPLGPLLPDDSSGQDWSAIVWERNP